MRVATAFVLASALFGCSKDASRPSTAVEYDTGTRPDVPTQNDTTAPPTDTTMSMSDTTTVVVDTSLADVEGFDALAPPLCAKGGKIDFSSTPIAYPGAAETDSIAAVTWDELTMAWTSVEGGKAVLRYADRASADEAFGMARSVPESLGPFSEADKVALSADGLRMLVPSADHKTIRELARSSRAVAFDVAPVVTDAYLRITGAGSEGAAGATVTDLVLSRDGKKLYFTNLSRTTGASIMASNRLSDGTWDSPFTIAAPELVMEGTKRRRPTGLSADNRTLFYFDEVTGASRAAFRPGTSSTFDEFVGVTPPGKRVTPNASCARLYMVARVAGDGATSDRIVHAP